MVRATGFATGFATGIATGVALALLAQVGNVQAQAVHKCIVNGGTVYQAAACPAANEEKSLVIPAAPSQQELLDATANARLQTYQANTGAIAPPAQRRDASAKVKPAQPQLTPSQQLPQTPASTQCEKLNESFHEAQYRRDELSAPGTIATRAEALQRVNDELKRTAEQANQAHCALR